MKSLPPEVAQLVIPPQRQPRAAAAPPWASANASGWQCRSQTALLAAATSTVLPAEATAWTALLAAASGDLMYYQGEASGLILKSMVVLAVYVMYTKIVVQTPPFSRCGDGRVVP